MKVNNVLFHNFKSYNQFVENGKNDKLDTKPRPKKKPNVKPLIGSTLGVASAYLLSSKIPKNGNVLNEVGEMLIMATGANLGGVIAGSIGESSVKKQKKCQEGAFQVMNIAIPMMMVTGALEVCKRTRILNNNKAKVVGSVLGMAGGAMVATKITNLTKDDNEPPRKYTIKDAVSNLDDIVATVKIGFKNVLKYVPVDKMLPFIYIYSGTRAGQKE